MLWGVTNPLMGKGSSGIQRVNHPNFLVQFGSELKFLLLNWKVSGFHSLFSEISPWGLVYCCLAAAF